MSDPISPYETKTGLRTVPGAPVSTSGFAPWRAAAAFVSLPVFGGVLGFGGYIAASSLFEVESTKSEPILSYGQQAMLISLPISTLIGVGIGVSLAFCFVCHRAVSATLLLMVAAIGYSITRSLWTSQIAEYGRDPSEAVLYHPLAAMCALAVVIAFAIVVIPSAHMRKADNEPMMPSGRRRVGQ